MTTPTGPAPIKLKNRKPGRPRKTPSAEGKPRDIKQDILDATVTLIAQFGFDGFVLRDVADAVGVHTALVGYYFKTKQQLEKAALDQQLGQIERLFSGLGTVDELAPREAIRSIFVELAKILDQGETGNRFNRWTLAKGGQYAEELCGRLSVPAMNLISRHFQRMMPELSVCESDARALLLFTLAENCANLKCDQYKYLKSNADHSRLVENYYRIVESQIIPEVCNLA
jgi:AcrR family transcriptional regulator